jgi:hypothetical protein
VCQGMSLVLLIIKQQHSSCYAADLLVIRNHNIYGQCSRLCTSSTKHVNCRPWAMHWVKHSCCRPSLIDHSCCPASQSVTE